MGAGLGAAVEAKAGEVVGATNTEAMSAAVELTAGAAVGLAVEVAVGAIVSWCRDRSSSWTGSWCSSGSGIRRINGGRCGCSTRNRCVSDIRRSSWSSRGCNRWL